MTEFPLYHHQWPVDYLVAQFVVRTPNSSCSFTVLQVLLIPSSWGTMTAEELWLGCWASTKSLWLLWWDDDAEDEFYCWLAAGLICWYWGFVWEWCIFFSSSVSRVRAVTIFVHFCCWISIVFVILSNLWFCMDVILLTMLSTTFVQSINGAEFSAGSIKI